MRQYILAILILLSSAAFAQKKPLDHDVYDSWESISAMKLTNDGSVAFYTIKPQEGDSKTIFRNVKSGTEFIVERAGALTVTEDGAKAIFLINPPFAATRQAKIEKKKAEQMPSDSLAIVDLKTLSLINIGVAKNFKTGFDAAPYIFAGLKGDSLLVYNTVTGAKDTLRGVNSYAVSKNGLKLAYISKKDKKDSLSINAVSLYDIAKDSVFVLAKDAESYSGLVFNESGSRLGFLATSQDEKNDGTPAHSIYLTEEAAEGYATRELVDAAQAPSGWVIGKNARLQFSNSSERIFLNLHQYVPAKDTTIVEFETAKLDIWVWNKTTLPPVDKVSKNPSALHACVNLSDAKLLTLSTNPYNNIRIPGDGDGSYAISIDEGPYYLDNLWTDEGLEDFAIINLKDGSRKDFLKASKGASTISPYGKYIMVFDSESGDWFSYNIITGEKNNVTSGAGSIFYKDDDDHPMAHQPIGRPEFMGQDEAVLITDRYDVWKFSLDGKKAENLTKNYGRENGIQFRITKLNTVSNPFRFFNDNNLPLKGDIYLTAFDENDSRNGFYSINAAKPGVPSGFLAKAAFTSAVKARNGSTILYTKGDFRNPNDVYQSSLAKGVIKAFENGVKLSDINPQQEDYAWGNVELVRWNAYDGTELKGLLFLPDEIDASSLDFSGGVNAATGSKKYPMMIYFYEKYSETLYNYRSPAPSASTVNIPLFVSRGYVVFIPDVVYTPGHPGESAYNCICAGAEALCARFPFIDSKRMAIQGQSWGGYQTAYLVARTNMFAAAGAGAPVSNMTSAYGGIRWESGNSRITQYEYGQSRIGKKLWEEGGLELYIENSPVFSSPKVETPLLIMHNDADGAVPWYQGIEYFMSLRRLGKPVWLLQYNDEQHNLMERKNRKDLSIRLSQFFDYYLLGAPKPAWMEVGIPYERKGQYFATELVE